MQVILKPGVLVVTTQTAEEREAFAAWRRAAAGHVFSFDGGTDEGGALLDLGPRADALREPINIHFDEGEASVLPIGNLALAPFTLGGRPYASVEGFWQGLKFASEDDRARVAALWGKPAKRAAYGQPNQEVFVYNGRSYATGGADHRELMLQACRAKFSQNLEARDALLATGDRPLTHRVRRDSKTIPAVLMADIWMRIRSELRQTRRGDGTPKTFDGC
jgi:predicted NAD-dependent protein-ADP-ribosyltransferase YbiA (DUF1768 family)